MDNPTALADLRLSRRIKQVREVFPYHSLSYIKHNLGMKRGYLDDTMSWLAMFEDEEAELVGRVQVLSQELQDLVLGFHLHGKRTRRGRMTNRVRVRLPMGKFWEVYQILSVEGYLQG
ncbi:hypothetical protein DOTSEDRAFT_27510 [Dothistroma septosporum NZE10]|uniref:Uncharacterized protein n=1 Tax=Dothistroma septosporum (strain NZE10 / CBS 128990) TaxID=675120 RepID=N1PH78_DOTSN|nr:hypothetical protein DOTSEDRAFT_27510 [Dothistroma septosporum NZE10]